MSGITDFMLVVVLEGDPARGLCLLGLCVPDQGALLHFPAWQRMSSPEHPLLEKRPSSLEIKRLFTALS